MTVLKRTVSYRLLNWCEPPTLLVTISPDAEFVLQGFWAEVFDHRFRRGQTYQAIYDHCVGIPVTRGEFEEECRSLDEQLLHLGVFEVSSYASY